MAHNPDTSIRLLCVPFDKSYNHVVYFDSSDEREEYMSGRTRLSNTNYQTIRTTRPDGSIRSSVRVDLSEERIRAESINYLAFHNTQDGYTRLYCAFVTDIVFISEGCTELVFELDVFQTYFFSCIFQPSFIERETPPTDEIGDNIVPESFTYQAYSYQQATAFHTLDDWGYLVAASEQRGDDGDRGKKMSGIYQGLYFYYFKNISTLNAFLDDIEEEGGDCIQFICVLPEFCARVNNDVLEEGVIPKSNYPSHEICDFEFVASEIDFDGYKPRNNKLYTAPFLNLVVTNHSGDEAVYNIEDFGMMVDPSEKVLGFELFGDISASPSVTLIPCEYQGVPENYDAGISISGFPQCSYTTDTFKLWLTKNQFNTAVDTVTGLSQIVVGAISSFSGVGALVGGVSAMTGLNTIKNTMNSVYQASKEPNRSHSGNAKNNLLTAIGVNKFDFYYRTIKREYAEIVDNFFTMYGYQVNKFDTPNFGCRKRWYYIKTNGANILGGIPNTDLLKLKSIFDNGVTLWEPDTDICDYFPNNDPV